MKDEQPPLLKCPFCGEDDYDPIGLKWHFGYCEAYAAVEAPFTAKADPPTTDTQE